MVATAIDIFPCIFPWKKLVYDGHKYEQWWEGESVFAFLVVGFSLEKSLEEDELERQKYKNNN